MSRIVAQIDINTQFCRNENWRVLRRAFQILEKKAKQAGVYSDIYNQVPAILLAAGVTEDQSLPALTGADFRPQARLAPIADRGKIIRFTINEEGKLAYQFLEEATSCVGIVNVGNVR